MKRGTLLLLLLAVLLVLLAAAFLLLEFRFQQARMATNSTVSTYAFGVDEETPVPLERSLDLYIETPLDMKDELAEALRTELASNPYVGDVNFREGPPAPADESVLVLATGESTVLFWTPFYVRTSIDVTAAYASDGAVDWIDEDVVVFENGGEYNTVVRVRGEYSFDGSAYGLISGPGYAHDLAEEVARSINRSLVDTLASQGGTR